MIARLFFLAWCLAALPALSQTACGSRLFVSGYNSTVHVFDACTGAYVRDLDARSRLQGAQAIRVGPDGLIYVISEETSTVQKYRNDTLEYAGAFASTGSIGPTGLAFDSAGKAYVAGYSSQDVRRFDRTGVAEGSIFAARSSGLGGPDNGMTFGPDGNLYVPGYDTHNVVRWDPRTNTTSLAVPARSAGLANTRGLLATKDGLGFYITGEGSGQLLRYTIASGQVSEMRAGLSRPTGIAYAPDGALLAVSGAGVLKLDAATGATLATFVAPGSGGIAGPTFLAVIPLASAATVDATQVGTQFWLVGDTTIAGRVIDVPGAYTATGTGFGTGLDFRQLAVKRWGTLRFELLTCTTARFTYDSTGENSAGFGSGGYDVQRFFEDEGTARCRERGIDHADKSWINGHWWGGQPRAGEGFFFDRSGTGTIFVAWFTHRPR